MIRILHVVNFLVLLCFVAASTVSGQTKSKEVNPTKLNETEPVMLGFRVPEEFWTHEFTVYENGSFSLQTLEKYRGKPLILDFWATWCTSCVRNFPKMERFKETYKGKLNFLLVNSFDKDTVKIVDIFTGEKYKDYRTQIPSIVFDDYLKALFPHQAVPIYIWIDAFGRLGATSTSDFLNDNQINGLVDRVKGAKK